jgi:hypothetical protein
MIWKRHVSFALPWTASFWSPLDQQDLSCRLDGGRQASLGDLQVRQRGSAVFAKSFATSARVRCTQSLLEVPPSGLCSVPGAL